MPFITVRNFSQMSLQTIFDRAVKHIGSTGKKSINPDAAVCEYSGSGCNAAPFILPEHRDDADAHGVWARLVAADYAPSTHSPFMAELQDCHDYARDCNFKADYDRRMRFLAARNKLNTKELDKLEWKWVTP